MDRKVLDALAERLLEAEQEAKVLDRLTLEYPELGVKAPVPFFPLFFTQLSLFGHLGDRLQGYLPPCLPPLHYALPNVAAAQKQPAC